MPQPADELFTTPQASAYLKVPIATLYHWRWLGIGPRAAKIGRSLRYRKSDLDAYFDQQATPDDRGAA